VDAGVSSIVTDPTGATRAPGIERSTPMSSRSTARADFEDFVVVRSGRLLRTAYLLTRDRGLAEDLLQTALAKAWLAWNRLDSQPEPYVRRIIVNTYATWWRRRWRGETPTASPPEPAAPDGLGPAAVHDLWVALGRLPRRQRAVVVLRYFEDLTEADTAELLGCSVGTVKSQAAKALAKLRVDPALDRAEPSTPQSDRGGPSPGPGTTTTGPATSRSTA
jgi:RNA polymerase sigma-70 factor (sigma-E family)